MRRRQVLGGLAATTLLPSLARAQATDYPNRPVRIITGSAPGSSNDVALRLLSDVLSDIWKQQVLVINQAGASGAIAARAAATAIPDGYTLYLPAASEFLALKGAVGVAENLPVELPRDFKPVSFFSRQPMFIAASPKLGVKTIAELIALAKKKPGEVAYATTGRGRITHLTMELLQQRSGTEMQLVAYAGGPTAAMPDVVSGRVGVVLEGYAGIVSAWSSGQIQPLAVATPARLADFPNLPTVAETLPGFQAGGWNVMVAPNGTPDAVVRKAAADISTALDNVDMNKKLAALGTYPAHMTPDEVVAFTQSEQKIWRPILEKVAKET